MTTAMDIRGCHLHVDCASGAAGDMMLAALIDLGVPVSAIGDALDAIGAGRERLRVNRIVKHGIAAVDVKVDTAGELSGLAGHHHHHHAERPPASRTTTVDIFAQSAWSDREPTHAHDDGQAPPDRDDHVHALASDPGDGAHPGSHTHGGHTHGGHTHTHSDPRHRAHVHYSDIRARLAAARLAPGVQARALDIFDRLARAEARLHGSTVDDVAFHEVGAIDSVVDVVGTAAALAWLAPVSVSCAAVAMGSGTLTCAHGLLPVPAPAALEVMREAGGVMADGGVARELCTPTGAAILAAAVTSWSTPPPGRALATGWGAGDMDLADRANVLRVVAMAPAAATASAVVDTVWQIEANVDDMSAELCAPAAAALFAAGAVDVWWSAITMKKGRPALTLFALAADAARDAVIAAILRETTTIGVRFTRYERRVLPRRLVTVETRFGAIPIKVSGDASDPSSPMSASNAAPEYDACAAAAATHRVPVKLVFSAALAAYDRLVAP